MGKHASRSYVPVVSGEIDASYGILAGGFLESALVDVELAERALPGGRAVAREFVSAVDAQAAVLARLRGALVDVGRAIGAGEAGGAIAIGSLADLAAGSPVQARIRGARIVDFLARRPGESVRARTPVLIGRGVLACAAVLAGLVGTAVVQILIAQNTAPVSVAYALPARAVAVAVLAARIGRALVAQLAPPAVTTLAFTAHVAVAVNRMASLLADGWKKAEKIQSLLFLLIIHFFSIQLLFYVYV